MGTATSWGIQGCPHGDLLGRQVSGIMWVGASGLVWHSNGMSPTTDRGALPAARSKPPPLDRQERVELLLAQTRRRIVPIRRTFVQEGRGSETKPGPLAKFLTAHDDRGLEAYLLVHAMAAAEPWNCRLPAMRG